MLQENGGSLVQAMHKLRMKILLGFSVEKQCNKVRIMGCLRIEKTLPGKVQTVCVFPLGLKILFGFCREDFQLLNREIKKKKTSHLITTSLID